MYSREIAGTAYTFGVSGKLIRNVLVMYDRQTNSLWSQLLGEAVQGPLEGTKLAYIPALHTTWAAWKAQHPDTLVLVKGYAGDYDGYAGYYQSSQAGVLGETYQDDRLAVKEFVVGVELNGAAVAYPFRTLSGQPVINDSIGGTPVLVVFDPESGASAVFDRRLAGKTLTFMAHDGELLIDSETGTTWRRLQGVAIAGPLAGEQLAPIKHTTAFWFGWKDWYPNTGVFGQ